ncbi:hypothetical protein GCM10010404_04110 [Nonomuraea africana]
MIGTGSADPRDIEPLGRILAATKPERKHPPGTAVTYDNRPSSPNRRLRVRPHRPRLAGLAP